jgi:predicted RND superfamily exporter protein
VQPVLSNLNSFFEAAPDRLLKRKKSVIAIFFVISFVLIYGMVTKFTMDMSLESWFQADDPTKVSLDKFRHQFGSDDGIYMVYEAADGDVFSARSIETLKTLHLALDGLRLGINKQEPSLLKRIDQIDSLYNARYQIADGDTLISKKLLSSDYPETKEQIEYKRLIANSQDSFQLSFYSENYRYGGMRLKTDFGVIPVTAEDQQGENAQPDLLNDDQFGFDGDFTTDSSVAEAVIDFQEMSMDEYLAFMNELRALTSKPEYQHFKFHFTGNAAMMEFAMNNMAQASMLMGLMLLAVVFLLWLLFRSFSAVIWPVLVISFSAFWSIGFLSLIGVTLSTMVSLSFMLILAVGTADCVHVLSAYMFYRQEGQEHREAMRMAYRKTGIPIFLTTITTMAGMSALMISDLPQIAIFGLNSALGVGVAFIFTVFLLPVLLDTWHPYHKKAEDKVRSRREGDEEAHVTQVQRLLNKVPALVMRRSKLITIGYVLIFGLFVYGTSMVKIDSNLIELAKEGSPIRVTYEVVDTEMMGAQNLEFILRFGEADALKDPKVLKTVDAFQSHLLSAYPDSVVKTFSIADFVKDTNMIMHEGNIDYKRIPDDATLSAQLLYLFDNANARDRRNIVSDDYSVSHISAMLRNKGSYEYTHFFEAVQADLDRFFEPLRADYPNLEVSVTGQLALMMELIDHISWTQIKSFAFALVIITVLLMFSLGSVQAGLISMIPNLLPAFFTFGLMGLLGIPLDTDTLIIAPLIIGIAVDDTIHFVAHYRDAWFESGDVQQALQSTIAEVGQAVTFTTLVLGVGFSMLAFSDYMGLAKTGIFGSLSIVVALSSDLFLLPALITWLKPDLGRKRYLLKRETLSLTGSVADKEASQC